MITPKTFTCTKCGECCKPLVKVSQREIELIKSAGKKDFTDDTGYSKLLKQKDGYCIFLEKQGEEYLCQIYDHRPDVCRKYPFIVKKKLKDCLPETVLGKPMDFLR